MGKIELHSEASNSRCCSNSYPGYACKNYVEGLQLSEKDSERIEIVVDQKTLTQIRKTNITYFKHKCP